MGVKLEIGKMFAYLLMPIGFFYHFSHKDTEYFRQCHQDMIEETYGNVTKKAHVYAQERIATEPGTANYNPKDIFWHYGEGLQYQREKKE